MNATGRNSSGSEEKREAFPPGTLVGERYRIVSPLARGGFGALYVAEQLATKRRVALKLLTSHVSDITIDRLLAEARLASCVNSEHIVQVYDAGIDPDSSFVFVAMELLSGMDLAELVRQYGPRSAAETAEYLRQVALGLDRVHGVVASDGRPAPIVHRDLKPANLFLTRREDGSAWLKILDFGAAKALSDDVHSSGVVRGTPEYMAYEQAAGGEVTRATDLWAFGLVAFTLLTGRSYWRAARTESGRAQLFGEVLTLPLAPASERAKELGAGAALPPAFDTWFFRCVNRAPSERYASAGEAARELARALGVTVHPVQVPQLEQGTARPDDAASTRPSGSSTREVSGVAASSRRTRAPRPALSTFVAALLALGAAAAFWWWSRATLKDAPATQRADAGSSAAPPATRHEPVPVPLAPQTATGTAPARFLPAPPASVTARSHPERPNSAPHGAARSNPSASSTAVSPAKQDDPYDLR